MYYLPQFLMTAWVKIFERHPVVVPLRKQFPTSAVFLVTAIVSKGKTCYSYACGSGGRDAGAGLVVCMTKKKLKRGDHDHQAQAQGKNMHEIKRLLLSMSPMTEVVCAAGSATSRPRVVRILN